MRAPLLPSALATLCPMLWAEPVQVATLPAKIVPNQATTHITTDTAENTRQILTSFQPHISK